MAARRTALAASLASSAPHAAVVCLHGCSMLDPLSLGTWLLQHACCLCFDTASFGDWDTLPTHHPESPCAAPCTSPAPRRRAGVSMQCTRQHVMRHASAVPLCAPADLLLAIRAPVVHGDPATKLGAALKACQATMTPLRPVVSVARLISVRSQRGSGGNLLLKREFLNEVLSVVCYAMGEACAIWPVTKSSHSVALACFQRARHLRRHRLE